MGREVGGAVTGDKAEENAGGRRWEGGGGGVGVLISCKGRGAGRQSVAEDDCMVSVTTVVKLALLNGACFGGTLSVASSSSSSSSSSSPLLRSNYQT